jgi:hypothetical protein
MIHRIVHFAGTSLTVGLLVTACASNATPPGPTPASGGGGAAPAPTDTEQAAAPTVPPPAGGCANPLFPVADGATWSYTLSGGPAGPVSYTSTVTGIDTGGFELTQAFTSLTVKQRWSCKDGALAALDFGGPSASLVTQGSQATFTTVSQEGVTLPAQVAAGDEWTQSFTLKGTQVLPGGTTGTSQGTASYSSKAIGMESVTVDAGTFDAMRVDGQMTVDLTVNVSGVTAPVTLSTKFSSWYAPGVGLVKMSQTGSLAGVALNVDNDLTSYSLP